MILAGTDSPSVRYTEAADAPAFHRRPSARPRGHSVGVQCAANQRQVVHVETAGEGAPRQGDDDLSAGRSHVDRDSRLVTGIKSIWFGCVFWRCGRCHAHDRRQTGRVGHWHRKSRTIARRALPSQVLIFRVTRRDLACCQRILSPRPSTATAAGRSRGFLRGW
jgi:hypothetical protein